MVPIAVCALGLTLLYAGIFFPRMLWRWSVKFLINPQMDLQQKNQSLKCSSRLFFSIIGMVIFSMIIGYKPALLSLRNRPKPLDAIWKEYPIWYDNVNVVGGYNQPSYP